MLFSADGYEDETVAGDDVVVRYRGMFLFIFCDYVLEERLVGFVEELS